MICVHGYGIAVYTIIIIYIVQVNVPNIEFIDDDALPAHDFVCEQHPAHLWILVLTLVNDGLEMIKTECQ